MTKTEAIKLVNASLGGNLLNERNTLWANLVPYAGTDGWWLNIPLANFRQEQHFLLNSEGGKVFRHLTMKARDILSPATKFRCKDQVADIFISAANPKKLVDVLPGGSKHSFNKYLVREYRF